MPRKRPKSFLFYSYFLQENNFFGIISEAFFNSQSLLQNRDIQPPPGVGGRGLFRIKRYLLFSVAGIKRAFTVVNLTCPSTASASVIFSGLFSGFSHRFLNLNSIMNLLDVKVCCNVFCSKFSVFILEPFQLHFSYSDDSASIAITKKNEPAALLVITNNAIRVIQKSMDSLFTFETLYELYDYLLALLLLCCRACNINISVSEAVSATLDCLPSRMLSAIS